MVGACVAPESNLGPLATAAGRLHTADKLLFRTDTGDVVLLHSPNFVPLQQRHGSQVAAAVPCWALCLQKLCLPLLASTAEANAITRLGCGMCVCGVQ